MSFISKINADNGEGTITSYDLKATQLKTARAIDGMPFDGSENINHYATCDTTSSAAAKVVSKPGFVLETGATINVKFTYANTATRSSLKMNVNNTGDIPIRSKSGYVPESDTLNGVRSFVYDGTYWQLLNQHYMDVNYYDRILYSKSMVAGGNGVFAHSLVALTPDEKLTSLTTTGGSGAKDMDFLLSIKYPAMILYYDGDTDVAVDGLVNGDKLYLAYPDVPLEYSVPDPTQQFPTEKLLYLSVGESEDRECSLAIQQDGYVVYDPTDIQTCPFDGQSVLIGCLTDNGSTVSLLPTNPSFMYGMDILNQEFWMVDKSKFLIDEIPVVSSSTSNGYIEINSINTKVYEHPNTFTAKSTEGFYKYTVNTNGHVTAGDALQKSDITTLGIPGSDTTYGLSGAYGSNNDTWITTLTAGGSGTKSTVPKSSTSAYGITKLYDGYNSTASDLAATANAVKSAYDLASGKSTVAFTSSLATGTKIGSISIDGTSTDVYCETNTDTEVDQTVDANTATNVFRYVMLGSDSSATRTGLPVVDSNGSLFKNANLALNTDTGQLFVGGITTKAFSTDNAVGCYMPYGGGGLGIKAQQTRANDSTYSYNTLVVKSYPGKTAANASGGGLLLQIQGGGLTIVGGGLSAETLAGLISNDQSASGATALDPAPGLAGSDFTGSDKQLILSSDNNIYLVPGCATVANRVALVYDSSRQLYPDTNETGSIGTSTNKWNTAYVKTINGNVVGNVTGDVSGGASVIYNVEGTQVSSTSAWTGNINVSTLTDGMTISYYLPYSVTSGNVTLNLTLADGTTTTGAIECYQDGLRRITTQYAGGTCVLLTYYASGSISIDGTATTQARWISNQNTTMIDVYGTGRNISKNENLNNYTTPGVFQSSGSGVSSTLTNCPVTTEGFRLEVKTTQAADRLMQMIYTRTTADIYMRKRTDANTWTSWYKFTGTAV